MAKRIRLLHVIGTRPEAIKMAPVILGAQAHPERFENIVVSTSQHREMLDQMLELFGIAPDVDLDVMQPNQDLVHITTAALRGLSDAMHAHKPHWVLVQGDTTTTFAGALAAFYLQIPVAHVEAGLRTGKRYLPFPEEINRSMTGRLATLHFAPTELARGNLLAEGTPEASIHVTGNTAIDALFWTLERSGVSRETLSHGSRMAGRSLLVTAHRRENQGPGMASICEAVLELVRGYADLRVVFPMHKSPAVRATVVPLLGGHQRIELTEPMDYARFVRAMHDATLILSDSGGVQEEAPSLGKPVLVLRDETERPEAVTAGTAQLVGVERERIVAAAAALLDDPAAYARIARIRNPFGDGAAARRILDILAATPQ